MLIVLIYVSAIVSANLSIAAFGPWVSPINAFIMIGLDLVLRDWMHDLWRGSWLWLRMLALIVVSGLVSWGLNPAAGQIAVASLASFIASGIVDAVVYHQLRGHRFMVRCNGSNAAGALADSLIFPTLAFGVLMPHIVALQFVAKLAGGFAWSVVARRVFEKKALKETSA